MITLLVIGWRRPASSEVFVSGDDHPAAVRARVERLYTTTGRAPIVAATWSPVVVDAVLRLWHDVSHAHGEDLYRRILLRGPDGDTPLTQAKETAWLAHISIGDLLARGEFDTWLDPVWLDPVSDPSAEPADADGKTFEREARTREEGPT